MISYLKGKLIVKNSTYLIIEVGEIGYHVNISHKTFLQIKSEENIFIHTHLHIKEDSHTLYGFFSDEEKQMFLNLISVSGIGTSLALVIQSSLSSVDLASAIINEDVRTIKSIKGIGEKTAQRLILELKDKLSKNIREVMNSPTNSKSNNNTLRLEALSALTTLGINKHIAEEKINMILTNFDGDISLQELIKLVLKKS